MPISTDSEEWKNGEKSKRFHKEVLGFLRDHPDQAYRNTEIADELLATSFSIHEERKRLREELSEEEFNERRREGTLLRDNEDEGGIVELWDTIFSIDIDVALGRLHDYDLVKARVVDADTFDLPHTEKTVVYTYDGDVDYRE